MQIAWKTQSGVTFSNVSRPASRNTARISPWVKLKRGEPFAVPHGRKAPPCATPRRFGARAKEKPRHPKAAGPNASNFMGI